MIFDGENRLIILSQGETELDLKELYKNWKTWVKIDENIKYPFPFRVIGGDKINDNRSIGLTFFICNNWKIRPYEGNHVLTVKGNLYSEDQSNPFVPTLGNYNVVIRQVVSNIIDTINISGYNNENASPTVTNTTIVKENSSWGVLN